MQVALHVCGLCFLHSQGDRKRGNKHCKQTIKYCTAVEAPFTAEKCWLSCNKVLSCQDNGSSTNASCRKAASLCRGPYPSTRCSRKVMWKLLVAKKNFQKDLLQHQSYAAQNGPDIPRRSEGDTASLQKLRLHGTTTLY